MVKLTLKDGRVYTESVRHATGAPENPVTDAQLEEKFRTLAGDALPRRRAERLLEMLWNLEDVPEVTVLMALTRTRRQPRS